MEQDIILRNYFLKPMITMSALKMKNCPVQQESDKIELSDTTQTDENINSKQTINQTFNITNENKSWKQFIQINK